jgi:hypothetical protein
VRSIVLPSWIERLAGLAPRPLAPHAFGISRRELCYAGFGPPGSGGEGARALLEAQSVPLPEGLFGPGPLGVPVGDRAAFAEAARILVSRLSKAPKIATVVLPDAWARGLMVDSTDLPEEPQARQEVLRFRLKRLVPFRTEDLRIAAAPLAAESAAGANGNGVRPARAFATFANEALCALVEGGLADAGVRVGWISGTTAALHAALRPASGPERDPAPVVGLAVVDVDGFTLVLSRGGEPVVFRQKAFTEGLADADRARLMVAELRLTRSHLEERAAGAAISELYLAAPRAVEPFWLGVLGEGLGRAPLRLRGEHVGVEGADGATGPELLALAASWAREL